MSATMEDVVPVPEELELLRRIAALDRWPRRVALLAAADNVEAGATPEAAYWAMFGRRRKPRRLATAAAR